MYVEELLPPVDNVDSIASKLMSALAQLLVMLGGRLASLMLDDFHRVTKSHFIIITSATRRAHVISSSATTARARRPALIIPPPPMLLLSPLIISTSGTNISHLAHAAHTKLVTYAVPTDVTHLEGFEL